MQRQEWGGVSTKPSPHQCSFPEEQEPSGRLILAPCLICGISAVDALSLFAKRVAALEDRKSTRLNSSHMSISYAVFFLKKKKKTKNTTTTTRLQTNTCKANCSPTLTYQS